MMGSIPDFMRGVVPLAPADGPANDDEGARDGEFIAAGAAAPLPPPPPFVPGVFDDMPAATYHAIEAMSSSGAKKMRKSPAHYRLMRTTANAPTPAMLFGTAVHAGVLEPATFADVVVCAPKLDRRTKAGKEAAAAFDAAAAGRVVLSPDDFDRCRRTIDAVLAHPSAAKLLAGAQVERSFFWYDARYKVPCKARFDAWNHKIVADLKTTQDASPDGFGRSIANFEYHAQGAMYCSGAEHLLDESPQAFVFIAVESEPPHAVACYALPNAAILAGMHLTAIALERYAEALELGRWKGYPDTIESIALPRWALKFS